LIGAGIYWLRTGRKAPPSQAVAVAEAERLGGADGAAPPPPAEPPVAAGEEPVPAGVGARAEGEAGRETGAEGGVQTVTDPEAQPGEARPDGEPRGERGEDRP
jgi:hypothetical protein